MIRTVLNTALTVFGVIFWISLIIFEAVCIPRKEQMTAVIANARYNE